MQEKWSDTVGEFALRPANVAATLRDWAACPRDPALRGCPQAAGGATILDWPTVSGRFFDIRLREDGHQARAAHRPSQRRPRTRITTPASRPLSMESNRQPGTSCGLAIAKLRHASTIGERAGKPHEIMKSRIPHWRGMWGRPMRRPVPSHARRQLGRKLTTSLSMFPVSILTDF